MSKSDVCFLSLSLHSIRSGRKKSFCRVRRRAQKWWKKNEKTGMHSVFAETNFVMPTMQTWKRVKQQNPIANILFLLLRFNHLIVMIFFGQTDVQEKLDKRNRKTNNNGENKRRKMTSCKCDVRWLGTHMMLVDVVDWW